MKTTTWQLTSAAFPICLTTISPGLQWTLGLTTVSSLLVTPSPSAIHTHLLWKYEMNIIRKVVLVLNKLLNPPLHCFYARIIHIKLSAPTTSLVNNAISANAIPSVIKCAAISPGFKKDDNLTRWNYRPVSVLPMLSKIYESVMNDQLLGYFFYKFHDFSCAFRRKYNCQSLYLKAVGDWKYALDQNVFKTGFICCIRENRRALRLLRQWCYVHR